MTTSLVSLRRRDAAEADLRGLKAYLTQLVGEPFRFARVSYGDELTLHFGELRRGRARGGSLLYGAYVLGLRASPWLLKSGSEPSVLLGGVLDADVPGELGRRLRNEDVERGGFVAPESYVLAAEPVAAPSLDGFALKVRTSDGSVLFTLPDRTPEAEGDGDSPAVADWELLGPHGLLSAWPGGRWTFEPHAEPGGSSPRGPAA